MFKRLSVKKALSLVLAVILVMTIIVGCDKKTETTTKDQTKQTEESKTRTITDMAGRKVTISKDVKKVYSTDPVGSIAVYTINPSKVAGLNYELTELEKKYTVEEYHKLPLLGGWFGKNNTGNIEEILKAKPDVIVSMGNIDEGAISTVEEREKQIGIPIVLVDGNIENLDKSYEFLGKVMGEEKKAKELADYCKNTLEEAKEIASKIPEDKKVRVYYAQGQEGLETDPSGSSHTQALDLVGAINVADVQMKSGYGRTEVSIEQVLNWNPDKIIVCKDKNWDSNSYGKIMKEDKWKGIKAVKDKQVYEIPDAPFNWFDRPPSSNRILGIKWLGNLLYPEYFKGDIKSDIKEFYEKFYHHKLTDEEINEILQNAIAN
ncbi:ABC-type Fe3+-hydroxamate transport system, periplasmic component [Gottschalkia purinilytica]|uniref:ABC-type Fe3+-hydroxamate transport system, periplasmic component n=1 Tax=Gottschalkia purinilytica TaxID=1503 RepID=A0A0L0WB70_GOTPU|nr:ABC transporter substrate-binding protein [Gottschalkia purinilytica]KNF08687.1 ABC-type Fe3+-hydroxamate transport system, periplasmic component [Gottschalkia purinilytica]